MPEEVQEMSSPERRFRDSRLGELVLSNTVGLTWGLGTFEGGGELCHLVFHDNYVMSAKGQVTGIAIFGIAGLLYGKFVRSQMRCSDNDIELIPNEDLRQQADKHSNTNISH